MKNEKLRAIGYARVSTFEQANEGISLQAQASKIRDYCALEGLELVDIIIDEGKSGKNLNRSGIDKIVSLSEAKEVDAVVVYKLDRLTRKTRDLLYLVEDVFVKNGIAFNSFCEKINSETAMGKFFLSLMGALAQMERDLISERTSDALLELKNQGRRLGNPDKTPMGFTLRKRKKAMMNDLRIDQKEMMKVKKIFNLRSQGASLSVIGQEFGLVKSSVKYILDNPIYDSVGSSGSANGR